MNKIINMFVCLFVVVVLNPDLSYSSEFNLTLAETEAYQSGNQGNINRYNELIDELNQPTGSTIMDQYLLGIMHSDHIRDFIEQYYGDSQYSEMQFAEFCVRQGYSVTAQEILSRVKLLDWGEEDWEKDAGINKEGEWVFPYWAPFWFLIVAYEEAQHDLVEIIWPTITPKFKLIYAAEYGDLKSFRETYEGHDWSDEYSKSVLKESLENAFASREKRLVDYLLSRESFEPVDILYAAANGGSFDGYISALQSVDMSQVDLKKLLGEAITGCNHRIVQDVVNKGAKFNTKSNIRSLLRTGIPELIHIALNQIDDKDKQLFLGLSNAYGPFSKGIGSWDPILSNGRSVYFIGVTEDVLSDDEVMGIIDGMINPGSNDTFPQTTTAFNWKDVQASSLRKFTDTNTTRIMGMEEFYQTTISYAEDHYLPYLGICGGSQHLILHNGGYIQRVNGHLGRGLQVSLFPGTVSHYMAMTPIEKAKFHQTGNLPSIIIDQVTVAHNFAGVEGAMGFGIDLGGFSEYNVPETFSKGLWMVGYQFHPEARYDHQEDGVNRNKQVLDSFLDLCILRKSMKNESSPESLKDSMDEVERETLNLLKSSVSYNEVEPVYLIAC